MVNMRLTRARFGGEGHLRIDYRHSLEKGLCTRCRRHRGAWLRRSLCEYGSKGEPFRAAVG